MSGPNPEEEIPTRSAQGMTDGGKEAVRLLRERKKPKKCPHCMKTDLHPEATRCPHCSGKIEAVGGGFWEPWMAVSLIFTTYVFAVYLYYLYTLSFAFV